MFYLVLESTEQRTRLIDFLKSRNVYAVFHYQSLHKSHYFEHKHDGRELPNSDLYSENLVRLPMYYDLSVPQIDFVISSIKEFFDAQLGG